MLSFESVPLLGLSIEVTSPEIWVLGLIVGAAILHRRSSDRGSESENFRLRRAKPGPLVNAIAVVGIATLLVASLVARVSVAQNPPPAPADTAQESLIDRLLDLNETMNRGIKQLNDREQKVRTLVKECKTGIPEVRMRLQELETQLDNLATLVQAEPEN